MSNDLFRKEVVEAKHSSWLGGISLAQPLRLWVLTAAAVLVPVLIALFLTFGTYTRHSRVVGQLVPSQGLSTVMAPSTGVIGRVNVAEGERVNAGQILAVVTVPRATLANGDTVAALGQRLQQRRDGLEKSQAAQEQILSTQEKGLSAQLRNARRELAQINAEIATRQKQVRIANETLEHFRKLQRQKYVSDLQTKQQEAAALEQVVEAQVLQRQAIGTRRMIAQLQQAIEELPAQLEVYRASFQRDLAALEQEQVETEARGELAVSAPVTGIVAIQLVKRGQTVQAGQPLLSLLPGDGKLEAELLVPSRAIGFVEPGDIVLLRYRAYPYQKFGHHQGRVARISRSALSPGELGSLIGNSQAGEPYYRVTVAVERQAITAYGKQEQLKPGMLLEADILGESRRLVEWVFEPLYSLKGRLRQ